MSLGGEAGSSSERMAQNVYCNKCHCQPTERERQKRLKTMMLESLHSLGVRSLDIEAVSLQTIFHPFRPPAGMQ